MVLGRALAERTKPAVMHSEDALEEDDSSFSAGAENCDYEIAGGRQEKFPAAVKNSHLAIECLLLGDD